MKILHCALCAALLLAACATAPEKPKLDTSKLQWPLPPAEAKVTYVREWRGSTDFKMGFADMLLGEEDILLGMPRSVTTDKAGNIYVSDLTLGLAVFDLKAGKFRIIETGDQVTLRKPADVLIHEDKIWGADTGRNKVAQYDKNGNFLMAIGKEGELKTPIRLAMDKARGRLYVLNKESNIRVYAFSGTFIFTLGEPASGKEPGYFFQPQGLSVDRKGNIYVADTFNFRVQSFTPEGQPRLTFGQAGNGPGDFGRPVALAVDSEGNIYVADVMFNNVQVFNKEGKYIFTIGEEGHVPGKFSLPTGIHIDENDRIYVVDQLNGRIQVFQYLSEKMEKKQAVQPADKK